MQPDIVTVKDPEPIEPLNITIPADLIMTSSSIRNETSKNQTASEPSEELEPEAEDEDEDMISAFFGNIFGTDTDSSANITEEVQPVAEVTQETDDEEDGITTFISNLFSSTDNSTVEEINTNST